MRKKKAKIRKIYKYRLYLFLLFAFFSFFGFYANIPAALVLDPYGIFWRDHKMVSTPSVRYLKVGALLIDEEKKGFIFSNSRGYFVDSKYAEELSKIKYYNMSATGDNMFWQLQRFKWLSENRKISQLLLLIWYDQFFGERQQTPKDLTKLDHPVVTGQSYFDFYFSFLDLPWSTLRREIISVIHGEGKFRKLNLRRPSLYGSFDLSTGERSDIRRDYYEEMTEEQQNSYYNAQFGPPAKKQIFDTTVKSMDIPFAPTQMDALRELVELAMEGGTDIKCVIQPMNYNTVLNINLDRYLDWIKNVVERCGTIYDFSMPSSHTMNNRNYREWSHFLTRIGDKVLEYTLGKSDQENVNFGNIVTKNNIDDFVIVFKEKYESALRHISYNKE